ncbi:DUF3040 domain-containing protein [Streptomyces griseoflavus]|uniref:DUF3040 domain-containing protein n=1 Tax=Streptomyces griseoflavus TaxID=35619 RepID=UPI0033F1874F
MSTGRLSAHERHLLDGIERGLSRDRRLDRRLRTLRIHRGPDVRRIVSFRPHGRTVAVLLAVSVTLMVTGIVTSAPWAIRSFAVLWPLTLFAGFRLLCRWSGG